MSLVDGTGTTTFTLKVTIPVYNETQGKYVSESDILKIDDVSGVRTVITWGRNPPSLS